MTTVLVRIENHEAARVGGEASGQKDEKGRETSQYGPRSPRRMGISARIIPTTANEDAKATGHGAAYSAIKAALK